MDLYERIKRIKEAQKQGRRSSGSSGSAVGGGDRSEGSAVSGGEKPEVAAASRSKAAAPRTAQGADRGVMPSPAAAPGGAARAAGSWAPSRVSPWEQCAPRVWNRSLSYDLPFTGGTGDGPHPGISSGGRFWENYLYIDSETTGLSSGAGTLVFLFGSGSFVPGGFRLIQWFLSDFPGEADFLQAVLRGLGSGGTILASYNGRSFDMPLLASRCILNGLPPAAMPHLDLLHSSRSLFRESLPQCNLGTIEEQILSITRDGDIPGREIPDRYFAHQRSYADLPPDSDPELAPVLSHHAQDILSLGLLHRRISELISTAVATGPASGSTDRDRLRDSAALSWGEVRPSARGIAIHLIRAGMKDQARLVLERFSQTRQDLRLQADLLRESCGPEAAVALWERLYREYQDPAAFRALLIHAEHRQKDFSTALSLLEKDGDRLLESEERVRRQERLLRKLMISEEP